MLRVFIESRCGGLISVDTVIFFPSHELWRIWDSTLGNTSSRGDIGSPRLSEETIFDAMSKEIDDPF